MPDYIIACRGGKPPATPEDGAAHKARWQSWIADLGEAAVNPGTPLGESRIVTAEAASQADGQSAMTGFSIVAAQDLEAALEIARACPFMDTGGTLEVAQVLAVPG